jgi:hypothetical protein
LDTDRVRDLIAIIFATLAQPQSDSGNTEFQTKNRSKFIKLFRAPELINQLLLKLSRFERERRNGLGNVQAEEKAGQFVGGKRFKRSFIRVSPSGARSTCHMLVVIADVHARISRAISRPFNTSPRLKKPISPTTNPFG